jgi:hypothetical protein
VTCLKLVVKLAEALLSSGAHLVVLERFCCSLQGDVRPVGGEVSLSTRQMLCAKGRGLTWFGGDCISGQGISRYAKGDVIL